MTIEGLLYLELLHIKIIDSFLYFNSNTMIETLELNCIEEINAFLLKKIRFFFNIEEKADDIFIGLNLIYYFTRDNDSTIKWVTFIESQFLIIIPDDEVDFFFFSDISDMTKKVFKNMSAKK